MVIRTPCVVRVSANKMVQLHYDNESSEVPAGWHTRPGSPPPKCGSFTTQRAPGRLLGRWENPKGGSFVCSGGQDGSRTRTKSQTQLVHNTPGKQTSAPQPENQHLECAPLSKPKKTLTGRFNTFNQGQLFARVSRQEGAWVSSYASPKPKIRPGED